jgi:tetratricopeptide (TPR) repeat protein
LEREAQTLRRERTRVIVWPDAIRDAPAATQVLHRTNASIVIWGTVNGGRITAGVVMVGENWQTYERGLNTLLSAPANPRLTINTESVADAQAFALFTLAQWHLNHEELGFARATLAQALASSPSEPDALAALNFYSGLLHQLTNPPELATAIQFYSQTLDLQADWLEAYLNRGVAYVRLNQAQAWQRDFAQALALQSDHVGARLAFCWAHGLDNQPQAALPHCDVAVSRDNTARSREARAIAYAEAGRWSEASADLTAFLDWLAKQPERLRSAYSVTPSDWLQMIKAQQNPFSQHVLERLRTE